MAAVHPCYPGTRRPIMIGDTVNTDLHPALGGPLTVIRVGTKTVMLATLQGGRTSILTTRIRLADERAPEEES